MLGVVTVDPVAHRPASRQYGPRGVPTTAGHEPLPHLTQEAPMDLSHTVTTHWTQQTSADHFDFLDEEE